MREVRLQGQHLARHLFGGIELSLRKQHAREALIEIDAQRVGGDRRAVKISGFLQLTDPRELTGQRAQMTPLFGASASAN